MVDSDENIARGFFLISQILPSAWQDAPLSDLTSDSMSSSQPTSTISDLGSSVADAHQFYVQQLEQKIQYEEQKIQYEREKNARLMSELFQRDMQIEQQRKRIRASADSAATESRQLKNKRRPSSRPAGCPMSERRRDPGPA